MSSGASIEPNWQALVAASLLGTGRQPPPSPAASDRITTVLAQIAQGDAEINLLNQAALLTIARKAGTTPELHRSTLSVAPEEVLPVASASANRMLAMMLGGSHMALIPEWLQLAAQRKVRVSEEHLPALLEMGANRRTIADAIRQVVGKRGEWLAALNPEWQYALGIADDLETAWETGNESQRIQAFRSLRQHDPNRARLLLGKSWANEPSNLRARIMPLLAIGLTMHDEEFLEAALDDRRKEVRAEAAKLLASLPQSKLSQRMVERLTPLLKVSGFLRKSIDITLPQECTAEMQRDGIEEKVPIHHTHRGEKSWWLRQMLSLTPTQLWLRQFNISPQKLIDYTTRNEWSEQLLDSWLNAAALHGETEPLLALADHFILNNPAQMARVADALPASYIEEKTVLHLRKPNLQLSSQDPIILLLFNYQRPWSEALSRLFVAKLQQSLTQPFSYPTLGWMSGQLGQMAMHISPSVCAGKGLELNVTREDWAPIARHFDEFVAVVQFRYEMRQAF